MPINFASPKHQRPGSRHIDTSHGLRRRKPASNSDNPRIARVNAPASNSDNPRIARVNAPASKYIPVVKAPVKDSDTFHTAGAKRLTEKKTDEVPTATPSKMKSFAQAFQSFFTQPQDSGIDDILEEMGNSPLPPEKMITNPFELGFERPFLPFTD